ncbi:hypothetical protein BCV70DRAFT_115791 [Testicularia cyperi]|uniref:Uncharacterized protein n=1 Tax=Testicularia cyperi TaxID=1882483 RepID=A0A317XLV4_9BASI|nr:hypothetical protein BCV70DRAFT_115791 [Testicularia cyperi]
MHSQMKRWSLCSTSLVEATNFLSRLKDAGLSCSNSSSGSNGGTAGVGDRSHGMEIPRPGDNGMAPVVGAFTGAGLATAGGPPEHGFQVLPSTVIDYQHREGGSNVGSSDFGCSSTSNGNSNSNSTSPGQDVFQKASTMPLHLPLPLSTHMPPLQFQFNHALMQGDSNANGNPHALATSTSTMPTDWSHPLSSGVHLNPASSVPNSTSTSASTTNLEPIHPSINGCQSESMHMPSQLPLSQPWSTTNCFHRPIFLYSTDADDAQAQAQQNGHHDESTKA